MNYRENLLTVAQNAAQSSAQIILKALETPRSADHKGRTDLVTETDRQSEENIKTHIRKAFPDHGILAEESGEIKQSSDYIWIIDPLDGTTNFVHGYPSFAVSIGIFYEGMPLVSVIVELPVNRIYTAIRGQGAFCDGKPIQVSKVEDIQKSLLVTGFGYDHGENWEINMKLFKRLTDFTQGVRRLGAAAVDLCHLAVGIVDGFWEFDLKPWDTAAGILLVEEAGGKITGMDGKIYSIFGDQILASNGNLHDQLLVELAPFINSPDKKE